MPNKISALELDPTDLIREVSLETIAFFVDGLRGVYLPKGFIDKHPEAHGVTEWTSENRLKGKFGRCVVQLATEEGGKSFQAGATADILVMGSTLGVRGVDHRGFFMHEVRHYELSAMALEVLELRGLDETTDLNFVDYGQTHILLTEDGRPGAIVIKGQSLDLGRGNNEVRQETCRQFSALLGPKIDIINADEKNNELRF